MKFLWKIGGEAGFGIMTTGLMFTTIASRSGYHVYDYTEYPSLIRGGHNTTDVVFGDEPVTATKHAVDMLVCLNKTTYEEHRHRLHEASIVVYDPDDFVPEDECVGVQIPFKKFKKEFKVMQIMLNTIALGASLALLDGDIDMYYSMIEKEFGRKGDEVVAFNKKLAETGYSYVKEHYASAILSVLKPQQGEPKLIMTGNDAFSLGTVMADCRMYSAYPMTPSSTVLSTLAGWDKKTGMVVRHAEDEISVIITALGSASMGVRTAVGTSGGGFALMVEAVSFAGIAEIPIVIFMSQRPGPATGMPTWTEQGDLLFTVNAGHGEFPKIVLAPGDVYEMTELALKAFDLADIYQTPVLVMSDKLLSESHQSHRKEDFTKLGAQPLQKGKTVEEPSQKPYLRYAVTEDGISERLLPGAKGSFYQVNSYEHEENSHTSEAASDRIAQVDKRQRKQETYLKTHFQKPEVLGDMTQAQLVLVSWGGNKGVILEAHKDLLKQGIHTAFIHFTHIYPMDPEAVVSVFDMSKKHLLIENNSHSQFGKLLRAETGIHLEDRLNRYDGRPFTIEEIMEAVTQRIA